MSSIYHVKSRYNDLNWIGKTNDGEFIAVNADGRKNIYQPSYEEDMADKQNYISNVGSWEPKETVPLSEKDKEFLESAYEGVISNCQECNIGHDTENSYEHDYQYTEDGIVCNECFSSYITENGIDNYVDQPKQCIPLTAAEALEEIGKLKFIERFIGGMVDGRGGSWAGTRVQEGTPTEILRKLKEKYPAREYVFSHDESGQFQIYFSVWQLPSKGKRFKTHTRNELNKQGAK